MKRITKYFTLVIIIVLLISVKLSAQNCNSGELGWPEIGKIFSDNGCTNCHGMVSSLDLRSYDLFKLGGVKCGSNITLGSTLVDIITTDAYAGCRTALTGQSMNDRVMGAMDSLEILQVQRWLNADFPETCDQFCIVNETINTMLDNAVYHFNVDSTIRANNSIANNSNINYEAGVNITLYNGFSVDTSSDFYAFIGDCDF